MKYRHRGFYWSHKNRFGGTLIVKRFVFLPLLLILLCVSSVSAQPVVKVAVLRASDQPDVYLHELNAIRDSIAEVQSFFASEMNRFGYSKKTFEFETNIPVYIGAKKLSEYEADVDVVRWQLGRLLADFPDDIILIFLAGASSIETAGGIFTHRCDATGNCNYRRLIVVPLEGSSDYRNRITAHELGHAFGFHEHLTSQKKYLMETYAFIIPGEGSLFNFQLHPEVARTLNASKDLSVIEGVNTEKFDKIVRRRDEPEVDVNDNGGNTDNIDADINKDGYVDLSDVLIVRSAIQNSVSYDTDVNNDGVTDEIDVLIVKAKAMEALAAAAPSSGMLRKRKVKITTWGAIKRN